MVTEVLEEKVHPDLAECSRRHMAVQEQFSDPKYADRYVTVVEEDGKYVVKDFTSFQKADEFLSGLPVEEQRGCPGPMLVPSGAYILP